MSELINNREYRQKILKELIGELHKGKTVDEVKPRFEKLIKGIDVKEITQMEQALIMEGMPVEEIQKLCDVHASVFKGSIEEIHRPEKPENTPGHPVYILKLENKEIKKLIDDKIMSHLEELKGQDNSKNIEKIIKDFQSLREVDKHYSRKENLLFPYLEKYNMTAPAKVMWGVDDEIRYIIREVIDDLVNYNGGRDNLLDKINKTINSVNEMIFKEENILFPMALETLSEDEWLKIQEESDEIGYTLINVKGKWTPNRINTGEKVKEEEKESYNGYIKFNTGVLSKEEINAMLNTLPLDITFVDKNGIVKYFSQGKERIFARTKSVIGREVRNCHPPASVHIVEQIIKDLKGGKKEYEDFWINMGDKYVLIRYFAVKDEKGEFLGIMEVTQNIKPIQKITGEKRLMSN
ncbi:DUF438 domain-containing protein [Defluviitalea phaphyphila]|uniref:DUF438 domain-containing protein n=1 Tax=Defluviitalea phaphyphila TaxID=1473580 RepID=UPI000731B169|nr:DUF438 domain-containing protein [Defluviitalea phaphyphila]